MNEEPKKLSIDFTQFLLRCVAEDLEASKELVGPGSPLSGTASREAARLLKALADGLDTAKVFDHPVVRAAGNSEGQALAGERLVICAEWSP